jgi:hypothetical protein
MGLGYHILVLMVRAYVYSGLYTICTASCTLFDQPTVTFLTAGDMSLIREPESWWIFPQ